MNGPGDDARIAGIAAHKERRAKLTGQYALALARTALIPVDQTATADDVYAFIYRDQAAADGWAESNRVNNGVPTLAKVPLPDGRVVGILDLRLSLQRAKEAQS